MSVGSVTVEDVSGGVNAVSITDSQSIEVTTVALIGFGNVDTNMSPSANNTYDLGASAKQWKDLYVDGTAYIDSLTLTSGATVTVIHDEDNFSSNSATGLATQQSIKAYVDAQITAQDLDFAGDSGGNLSIDLDSEILTIAGGNGIDTTGGTNTLTVALNTEYVQDIAGAMFTGNTETGITATYQDGDGTVDLVVGTLNQDTTGNAATATALETARTIGGVSFNGTANIVPATITVADTTDTSSFVGLWESATGDLAPKTDAAITYNAGTGALTATTFVGALTGNASGTAATVTGAAQTNITSLGTLTALVVDDVAVDGKVVTMTGSSGDTATFTAGTNGTLDIATTDAAAAAANIQITADGTAELAGTTVTLDSGGGITLDADSGTITFADGGSSLGTITSSGYTGNVVGNVTGNVSGSSGSTTGNAATATALATGRTIGMTGDVVWTSASFDGSGNVTGSATIQANSVALSTDTTGDYVAAIVGGTGIDSGGATSGEGISHTLSLDLNELATETSIAQDDFVAMVDATDSASGKITFSNLEDEIFGNVSGDVVIAAGGGATIQANSVALATDTTGNYVATVAGTTNEITVSGSGSENASVTIGLPDDVTIAGDLTINGDTTTVNTATLSVEDPLIILAKSNNSADSVDIGFYGLYDTSGSQDLYAGLFRDANDSGKFKLFKDLQAEPSTTVNTGGTGYAVATLVANIEGDVTGNLVGNVTGNASGTAATVTGAAQSAITSLGTLTTLTVDNVAINGTTIGHTSDTDLLTLADGVLTVAGEVDATSLDISGNADIDGTTNLDVVDIDGAVDMASTLTLAGNADFNGDLDVDGTTNLDVVDIDGASQLDGTLTVGVDDTGYDVKFFGATSGKYALWDESANSLVLSGTQYINHASSIAQETAGAGWTPDLQTNGTTNGGLAVTQWNAANTIAASPKLWLSKNGGGTIGTHAQVVSAENLGTIYFSGSDGTDFVNAASIHALTGSSPGSNDMPGILVFSTTADGAASVTERMRIDEDGKVGIGLSNAGEFDDLADTLVIGTGSGSTGLTIFTGNSSGNTGNIFFADGNSGSDRSAGRIRYDQSTNAMSFGTAASNDDVVIDSSGNVGIGHATPSAWHSDFSAIQLGAGGSGISGGATGNRNITLSNNAYLDASGDWVYAGTDHAANIEGYDGTWHFKVAASGSADADITWTEALALNNDGTAYFGDNASANLDYFRTGSYGAHASSLFYRNRDASATSLPVVKIMQDHASDDQDALFIDQDGNASGIHIDTEATTAPALYVLSPKHTTGNVIQVFGANDLTTGTCLALHSDGADTSTRNLAYIINDNANATGTTALKVVNDSTGLALDVIGTTSITTTGNEDTLSLISTDTDSNAGPNLLLHRNSGSPADNDLIGSIKFDFEDDGGNQTTGVNLFSKIADASNTTEDAWFEIDVLTNGSALSYLNLYPGEISFNDDSNDIDFRVESNDSTHMLFVDGGLNRVGIGKTPASNPFEVAGAATFDSNVTVTGALTVGVDDTGHDVKFFGATAGKYFLWDESQNEIDLAGEFHTVTAGTGNLALGQSAGAAIAAGANYNVLLGNNAGAAISTGDNNVAVGYNALMTEDAHGFNVAVGKDALKVLNAGAHGNNVAVGALAGTALTAGTNNIFIGYSAGTATILGGENVAIGYAALLTNDYGSGSTGVGHQALRSQDPAGTSAVSMYNTALGYNSSYAINTGQYNTNLGAFSGSNVTSGNGNVSVGYASLYYTTGEYNVAIGYNALAGTDGSSTASYNIAIGGYAGDAITVGDRNVALGYTALSLNTVGDRNVAFGAYALATNNPDSNEDSYNTAVGEQAGYAVSTGKNNTLVGGLAGNAINTGNYNTSLGYYAGSTNQTGSYNVCLGWSTNTDANSTNYAIAIGTNFTAEASQIDIGHGSNTTYKSITATSWSFPSDERIKTNIVDENMGLSFINRLQPRKFNWKASSEVPETLTSQYSETESWKDTTILQHGFVAQEVKAAMDAESIPDTYGVWNTKSDGTQGLAPGELVIPLVNAVKELAAENASLKARIEALESA